MTTTTGRPTQEEDKLDHAHACAYVAHVKPEPINPGLCQAACAKGVGRAQDVVAWRSLRFPALASDPFAFVCRGFALRAVDFMPLDPVSSVCAEPPLLPVMNSTANHSDGYSLR
ncbi:hypothetical protein [Achromobacter sp. ESBL13]|uniref:hypothetical protein n=1 Tax=Achromobacter sp. ESBL13 TaxID=3077328 RepID=UPI002FC75A86